MAPQPTSSNEEWLESIMRRMFSQTRSAPGNSPKSTTEENAASHAARDARRFVRMALQMAIGMLDAADEKQDEAERLLQHKLKVIEEQSKAEKQRIAHEEQLRRMERARQAEVEEMRRSMERLHQEDKEQARMLEEKKREALRQREEAERRTAEQAAAKALKQAQAEAKKYREAAERAQKEATQARERAERAEEAQRQSTANVKPDQMSDDQKAAAAWSRYTDQWELFKRLILVVGPTFVGGILRFEDIPWPTVSCPTSPSMITKEQVAAFLYSRSASQGKSVKIRIRECLLTWHPDKFSGRWMQLVLENDRMRVAEGVLAVTRAGNEIMAEYTNRRNTL
ncbi:hypothetical protein FRC12_003815 [Ceratobasidium sp. 428]|nr:hypothetical protein FRC12_003815 [Ceratobasidium sp. 428]